VPKSWQLLRFSGASITCRNLLAARGIKHKRTRPHTTRSRVANA
jgi:hypothetical protein